MKKVIYQEFGTYCVTDEENYKASIQNASKITRLKGFTSPQQIIDYFVKYSNASEKDFIVI